MVKKGENMKKFLTVLAALFLAQVSSYAATTIIENYDATKLKQDIIGIYTLRGAVIESNELNKYSFSIKTGYITLWNIRSFRKNITIVPRGKDCLLSLTTSPYYWQAYDIKELAVLKKELKGGYTYGLNYFVKTKTSQNKNYMSDGIDSNATPTRISNSNDFEPVYVYNIIPKSMIKGPRLISTSYSAKEEGLKAKNRIVEINGKRIKNYKPEEVWDLLNPTNANQTVEIGYKEKAGSKIKHVTLHSRYQKPLLECL